MRAMSLLLLGLFIGAVAYLVRKLDEYELECDRVLEEEARRRAINRPWNHDQA